MSLDKAAIKKQIQELKQERSQALEARNKTDLKVILRKIHRLKHKLRTVTV